MCTQRCASDDASSSFLHNDVKTDVCQSWRARRAGRRHAWGTARRGRDTTTATTHGGMPAHRISCQQAFDQLPMVGHEPPMVEKVQPTGGASASHGEGGATHGEMLVYGIGSEQAYDQLPIAGYQLPMVGDQTPMVGHQLPVVANELSMV